MRDQLQDLLLGDPLRVPFVCTFRGSWSGHLKRSITNLGGRIGASRKRLSPQTGWGQKKMTKTRFERMTLWMLHAGITRATAAPLGPMMFRAVNCYYIALFLTKKYNGNQNYHKPSKTQSEQLRTIANNCEQCRTKRENKEEG
jgi:hypothetical protein